MSGEPRTGAVLFARDLDRVAAFYAAVLGLDQRSRADDHILLESPGFQLVVHRIIGDDVNGARTSVPSARRHAAAFKPVFFVPGISSIRGVIESHGGTLDPADREWTFDGCVVRDATDPEGNVFQLRARAGDMFRSGEDR